MAGKSNEGFTVKLVETERDLEAAIAVRFRVFVAEQAIPAEEELDEADATATHAIALRRGCFEVAPSRAGELPFDDGSHGYPPSDL